MEEKNKKRIITHGSKFHPDDIFGVATLLLLLEKEGKDSEVIRTRDPEIIKTGDYVLDVGLVYDESKNLFDHHQIEGAGSRPNTVPYSSFGLVWKKYGEEICGSKEIADKIDLMLVQPIDANDNGIDFVETKIENLYPADIKNLFYIFRPTWKEGDNTDKVFIQLASYAKFILQRMITYFADDIEAEHFVLEAYKNAGDKRVIILDERYPWEETLNKFPEPLFVIYPKRMDSIWSLKAVRDDTHYYISRKDLPEKWAGKSGEEFENITGVKDAMFCHKNLFLAVAKTKEAILKLAEIAINY